MIRTRQVFVGSIVAVGVAVLFSAPRVLAPFPDGPPIPRHPIHCETWNDGLEVRCSKGDRGDNIVQVTNVCRHCTVTFTVTRWLSMCGFPGDNINTTNHALSFGEALQIDFGSTSEGICRELYVQGCELNGNQRVPCGNMLHVTII